MTGTQAGANVSNPLKASSYLDYDATNNPNYLSHLTSPDFTGEEPWVTADSNYMYFLSRDEISGSFTPYLNICSRTASGSINLAAGACSSSGQNIGSSFLGTNGHTNLAGSTAGSGPQIVNVGKKILFTLQNMDPGVSGSATGGASSVIICQKPTVSPPNPSGCTLFPLSTANYSGQWGSIAATTDQVFVSNTGTQTSHLVVRACSYDSTQNTTDSTTLNSASCKSHEFMFDDQGWYTSIAATSGTVVAATSDRTGGALKGLRIAVCSVDGSNVFTNCTNTLADNSQAPDNSYPGGFPSVALDVASAKIYVASQIGEEFNTDTYSGLRLTACDITPITNALTCSSQTVDSNAYTGVAPHIAIGSDRLWISASSIPTDSGGDPSKITLYQCLLPLGSNPCTNISPYFTQLNANGSDPLYFRSFFLDTAKNILLAPYNLQHGITINERLGIFSIGVPGP